MKGKIQDYFQKEGKALVMPIVMIVIGLLFILFPGSAISATGKLVGIVLVVVGAFIGCSLMATFNPMMAALAGTLVVLGIVSIAAPGLVAGLILKIIGIFILIHAVLRLMAAYKVKSEVQSFKFYFGIDTFSLAVGLLLVFVPHLVASWLVIVVGIVLLISGLSNIVSSFKFYKEGGRYLEHDKDGAVWEEKA